ncbi:hypothetical protein [Hymenobacter rubripertinctus]|uniref:Uncharacterized protein n=1 Tax=Hymenobacter rubripertinctus TaxID=2029981 RepID=A0A418R278_9BACT|nr:hypothetical protein [Hymenobacter rubripertinctus]RIY11532.1 hypothetical protein D0T11_06905 [Hymenobacter rubripertinctus]
MAEDYAAKMSRKTAAELRDYVDNRYQYREEAVLAALEELARRGTPEPNAVALTTALQTSQQETDRRESVARAEVADQDQARRVARGEVVAAEPTGPALYSPGTIALFSILPMSTMIGGGVLLGLNLVRLRQFRGLALLVVFVLAYIVLMLNLVMLVIVRGGVSPIIGYFLFNVPAILVYVRWFWPRYIATENYRGRSLLLPIIVCFLLSLALQYAMPYLQKQQPPEVQQQMKQLERLLKE